MAENPKHMLLHKDPLAQIAAHLKELGRKKEAKEVREIIKELHSKKK